MKAELRQSFVDTNGIRLSVQEAGNPAGKPVVLLHGFPEFWFGWHRQIDFLVDGGYRVIVPDQRGYNRSDKPRGRAAYGVDHLAQDILGILDHFGIERTHLIGHDWGGVVAWHLAMHHPQRLIKLVNLNIPHPNVMVKTLKKDSRQRRKSWYIFFFQLPFLPECVLRKNGFQNLKLTLLKTSRPGTFTDEMLEKYVNAWQQPGALTAMLHWYRAAALMMFKKRPSPRITVPTLLIWGKKDKALSHEMAHPSIERCENGRLVMIEDASHWVQHEAAAQVNEHVHNFFTD